VQNKSKAPILRDKNYSPYYLEKRFGGLEILSRDDKSLKRKPDNIKFSQIRGSRKRSGEKFS